jgi:YgiT-type zinc finger domain-containing protein
MMNEETRCSVCGATLRSERITYAQPTGDSVVLVAGVPTQVCPQCGEEYLSADTVDAIQQILQERPEPELVSVTRYHYAHAVRGR